jgi:MerR family mercuric resistance operon transcriptional regulator
LVSFITRLRGDGLSIGQLSRRTGVNLETIRYYERIGVLGRPPRTAAGHRVYGAEELRALTFIHRARQLGFPLSDIRALLALRDASSDRRGDARDITLRHLARVRAQIADLRSRAGLLERITQGNGAESGHCCPVMELLEGRHGRSWLDEPCAAVQEVLAE